jgi:hypothetical protein
MQSVTTTMVSSTINSFTYSDEAGFGFSAEAFNSGIKSGLVGAAGSMTSTFTSGLLNLGLTGFVNDLHTDGTKLSGLIGGLAGQGVEYALGGNFTLNVLNLSMLGIEDRKGNAVSMGLLEMSFGREGFGMALGTGGVDASYGTIASAVRGLEAWKVNGEIWTSKREAAKEYASGMRTLYSLNDVTRAEYEAMLAGKTVVEKRSGAEHTESKYDETTGIKTVYFGQNALGDGSEFGLNVYFAHEAYRDGKEGDEMSQSVERDNAVKGHIDATQALIQTYGAGAVSAGLIMEAMVYTNAGQQGRTGIQQAILDAYDSSADYWKLTDDGKLIFDGQATVYDDETGEVLISLDDLNMSDNGDYTTSLAKLMGIGNDRANEIIKNMSRDISGPYEWVQLGYGGGSGLNADDYINALRYTLNRGELVTERMINGQLTMAEVGFSEMSANGQLDYLKSQVVIGGALPGEDKGKSAEWLRGLRDDMMLKELFKKDTFISSLFTTTEYGNRRQFMNENLRDFMNLNFDGTMNYSYSDLTDPNSLWVEMPSFGSQYHQTNAAKPYLNAKFVHPDGREVVIAYNGKDYITVTSYPDRGTYNYVNGTATRSILWGGHNLYDMIPYDELMDRSGITRRKWSYLTGYNTTRWEEK